MEYKFPKIWIGYIFALLFLVIEVGAVVSRSSREEMLGLALLISLPSLIYWCICVYKIHKGLQQMTNKTYPISPAAAVGFHFIPFYNLYWIFKWTGEAVNFMNTRDKTRVLKGWVPGLVLLLALFIGRGISGTIGITMNFAVLSYLVRALKRTIVAQPEPVPYSSKCTKPSPAVAIIIVCIIGLLFFALVAAIAIPNFIRARQNAYEAAAIVALKQYCSEEELYKFDNLTYKDFPEVEKMGYRFKVINVTADTYTIKAEPVESGPAGRRVFIVDETGVIKTENGEMVE